MPNELIEVAWIDSQIPARIDLKAHTERSEVIWYNHVL